jgi:uncharacterized metal-binding protein YceD (DUF177 family)
MTRRHNDKDQAAAGVPGPVSPLRRKVRVEQIRDGEQQVIELSPTELAEITALQELQDMRDFRFTYALRRGPGESVRLKGRLRARPTQTCVISLQPVESLVDVPVEADFWPAPMIERWHHESDDDSLAEPTTEWPEPIEHGMLDLGPLVYETFAMALDPYPRAEGASLEWSDEVEDEPAEATRQNPFAALERLKRR